MPIFETGGSIGAWIRSRKTAGMTSTSIIGRLCVLSALLSGSAACSPAPQASAAPGQAPDATGSPARAAAAAPARAEDTRTGLATYIADRLHGRKTASGEPYDKNTLVAAHPTYPVGTVLRVRNEANGRVAEVRIVDRNAQRTRDPQSIDLSRAAAERLDFIEQGTAKVTVEVVARPSQ